MYRTEHDICYNNNIYYEAQDALTDMFRISRCTLSADYLERKLYIYIYNDQNE